MDIVWINKAARVEGQAEERLLAWVEELKGQGLISTLLYGTSGRTDPRFTSGFERAFPLVDLNLQLQEIEPDLIWVNSPAELPWPQGEFSPEIPLVWCCHNQAVICPDNIKPAAWVVFSGEVAGHLINRGIERQKIQVLNPAGAGELPGLFKSLISTTPAR